MLSVDTLITVLSLCFGAFSAGYAIGFNSGNSDKNTQK